VFKEGFAVVSRIGDSRDAADLEKRWISRIPDLRDV